MVVANVSDNGSNVWLQVLASVGGATGAMVGVVAVYRARADKRQVNATTEVGTSTAYKTMTEATVVILNPLIADNKALRERIEQSEKRISDLEASLRIKEADNEDLRWKLHQQTERYAIERRGFEQALASLQDRIRNVENGTGEPT